MAFDEAKFRAAAKAAGYSDKEIDAELGTPAGASSPASVRGPETSAKLEQEFQDKKGELQKGFEENKQEMLTTSPMTAEGVLTSTPALVTGAAILGALTTYAAPKISKGIKERYMTKAPELDRTIDIPTGGFFDVPPNPNIDPVDQPSAQASDKLKRAEELAEANRQLGIGGNQPVAPGPIARNALPMGAVNPAMFSSSPKAPRPDFEQPISTPITSAPPDAPAPTPTSGPGSPTTTIVNDTVKEMIQQEPPQGMYRDPAGNLVYPKEMSPGARAGAEAFAQQYPEHAAALEAEKRFGILGAGAADNNLFNAYGADLRKQILNEVNQGQPAGVYQNYTQKINPAIKAIPPESALGKQLEDLRVNQPKSATRGSLGLSAAVAPGKMVQGPDASKFLKGAGKAALVMAMADAANAATKGDYVGAAKIAGPALDPTGILEAAVNPQSTARNLTNVSPVFGFLSQLFASQADERAKKAYVEKVGAGRGLTPASAYPR